MQLRNKTIVFLGENSLRKSDVIYMYCDGPARDGGSTDVEFLPKSVLRTNE